MKDCFACDYRIDLSDLCCDEASEGIIWDIMLGREILFLKNLNRILFLEL